jgi:hypothetical protein
MQLQIEREALVEKDGAWRPARPSREELAGLEEESTETSKWQAEKQKLGRQPTSRRTRRGAQRTAIAQRKGEFQRR